MKYVSVIDIDLPRPRVVELFDDPENMKKWMQGLQEFTHLSGLPGQIGARSKLLFRMGNRRVEMIETITSRNLPDTMGGTYEAKGVFNLITVRFIDLDGKTRYVSEQEFRFSGLFMKLMARLMPGAFKKQTMKYMQAFKEFAEKEG